MMSQQVIAQETERGSNYEKVCTPKKTGGESCVLQSYSYNKYIRNWQGDWVNFTDVAEEVFRDGAFLLNYSDGDNEVLVYKEPFAVVKSLPRPTKINLNELVKRLGGNFVETRRDRRDALKFFFELNNINTLNYNMNIQMIGFDIRSNQRVKLLENGTYMIGDNLVFLSFKELEELGMELESNQTTTIIKLNSFDWKSSRNRFDPMEDAGSTGDADVTNSSCGPVDPYEGNYAGTRINIGYRKASGAPASDTFMSHGIMSFDVSAIPSDATIDDVNLSVYVARRGTTGKGNHKISFTHLEQNVTERGAGTFGCGIVPGFDGYCQYHRDALNYTPIYSDTYLNYTVTSTGTKNINLTNATTKLGFWENYHNSSGIFSLGIRLQNPGLINCNFFENAQFKTMRWHSAQGGIPARRPALQVTYTTAEDTTPPDVVALIPVNQSQFNTSQAIEIGANVTDDTAVDFVMANVTLPNSSVTQLPLSQYLATEKYNASFSIPNLNGTYNVTFFANDTSDNINNTETTQFYAYKTEWEHTVILGLVGISALLLYVSRKLEAEQRAIKLMLNLFALGTIVVTLFVLALFSNLQSVSLLTQTYYQVAVYTMMTVFAFIFIAFVVEVINMMRVKT